MCPLGERAPPAECDGRPRMQHESGFYVQFLHACMQRWVKLSLWNTMSGSEMICPFLSLDGAVGRVAQFWYKDKLVKY